MTERILIHIERPEVGIEYRPATPEALPQDELAASELALHALAGLICVQRNRLGLPILPEILAVINSNAGRRGLF